MSKTVALLLSCSLVATLAACSGDTSPSGDASKTNDPNPSATDVEKSAPKDKDQSEGKKANAEFKDKLDGPDLLTALQAGGHIIYFRHAQTEKDGKDQEEAKSDLENCKLQRQLSEEGIQQAKDIGVAFAEKSIPVGEVITSEYCRTWKTADLAFGKHKKNPNLNFLPSKDYTDEQAKEATAKAKPLLTTAPKSGQNTVLVGHSDVFEVSTGISPDPQGMAYVLTPDNKGGYEIQANVLPEEWSKL